MDMNSLEIMVFAIICFIIVCFNGMGWVFYKLQHLNSWEDGIKLIFHYLNIWLHENITGEDYIPPEEEIDERLYLSSEELVELSKQLETVYEQPCLKEGVTYTNGIAWFDYSAYCINLKYKEISLDDRKRLISSIVKKYYQRIRGTLELPIHVKICSDFRLYFAVPLNPKGNAYLQKQEEFNSMDATEFATQYSTKIIQEEIPQDSENEIRL